MTSNLSSCLNISYQLHTLPILTHLGFAVLQLEARVEQGRLDTVGQQVHAVELPLRVDVGGLAVCDMKRVCD